MAALSCIFTLILFQMSPQDCSLTVDSQHGSAIQPSVWPALLASSPYPDAREETGPQGTDLLGCWP